MILRFVNYNCRTYKIQDSFLSLKIYLTIILLDKLLNWINDKRLKKNVENTKTSAQGQDRVTETRVTPQLENQAKQKKPQFSDFGQQARQDCDPEGKENKVNATAAPSTFLSGRHLLSPGASNPRAGRSRQLESPGQGRGRFTEGERALEILRGLWLSTDLSMCKRKLPKAKERNTTNSRQNNF